MHNSVHMLKTPELYFKKVNFMVCELYLNKTVIKSEQNSHCPQGTCGIEGERDLSIDIII